MGIQYSKYLKEIVEIPRDMCALVLCPSNLYGANIPEHIRNNLIQIIMEIFDSETPIKFYNPVLFKFQLKCSMLYQEASEEISAKSRLLFCKFLEEFEKHGWNLLSAPTLAYYNSISTWLFYKDMNIGQETKVSQTISAIGISSFRVLQCINISEQIVSSIKKHLETIYSKKIPGLTTIKNLPTCLRIEFEGTPWHSDNCELVEAQNLVLETIKIMEQNGWHLICSAALKPDASDTLFFKKLTTPTTTTNQYFLMCPMRDDWLALVGSIDASTIRDEMAKSFITYEEKGIKECTMKRNYPVIKFNSRMWKRTHKKELKTRRTLALLFQDMASIGWMPIESIDCSRSKHDLSSVLFKQIHPCKMAYFCLMPQKSDTDHGKLYILNAPLDVIQTIFRIFKSTYPVMTDKFKFDTNDSFARVKFPGDEPYEGDNAAARLMFTQSMLNIVNRLKEMEWYLSVTADTSTETKTEYYSSFYSRSFKYTIHALWFSKVIE